MQSSDHKNIIDMMILLREVFIIHWSVIKMILSQCILFYLNKFLSIYFFQASQFKDPITKSGGLAIIFDL